MKKVVSKTYFLSKNTVQIFLKTILMLNLKEIGSLKSKFTLTWLLFWKVGIIYLPGWQETSKVVSSPWWTGSMSDDNVVDNFTCHPTTPIWTNTNIASDLSNFNWKLKDVDQNGQKNFLCYMARMQHCKDFWVHSFI